MRKKICKTCGWRFDSGRELSIFHKDNEENVRMAEEYCKDYESTYGGQCKPLWCEECGHHTIYQVKLTETSKENPNFDKRK